MVAIRTALKVTRQGYYAWRRRPPNAHAGTFETRKRAALEIFEHIECLYNRARILSALGNLSPTEFEARHMEGAVPRAV